MVKFLGARKGVACQSLSVGDTEIRNPLKKNAANSNFSSSSRLLYTVNDPAPSPPHKIKHNTCERCEMNKAMIPTETAYV